MPRPAKLRTDAYRGARFAGCDDLLLDCAAALAEQWREQQEGRRRRDPAFSADLVEAACRALEADWSLTALGDEVWRIIHRHTQARIDMILRAQFGPEDLFHLADFLGVTITCEIPTDEEGEDEEDQAFTAEGRADER